METASMDGKSWKPSHEQCKERGKGGEMLEDVLPYKTMLM